jgi:predicted transcriptional regulator
LGVLFSYKKVREIRRLYSEGGISQKTLSEMFGCSKGHIKHILKNRIWREE